MKIEFGCGATPTKKDFSTCDIRDLPGIDYVCPAWEISEHVASDSVSEIFSRHFLEHLTFVQAEKLVDVWYKILKPSGVCELLVPNMDFHINQWIHVFQNGINTDKDKNNLKHACAGFWVISAKANIRYGTYTKADTTSTHSQNFLLTLDL